MDWSLRHSREISRPLAACHPLISSRFSPMTGIPSHVPRPSTHIPARIMKSFSFCRFRYDRKTGSSSLRAMPCCLLMHITRAAWWSTTEVGNCGTRSVLRSRVGLARCPRWPRKTRISCSPTPLLSCGKTRIACRE